MININIATATAADLLQPLIQTLRCHEKTRIEPQARFCDSKLSELDKQNSVMSGKNTAQDITFYI